MTKPRATIAVLRGGQSAEAAVSHMSAGAIVEALADQLEYRAEVVDLSEQLVPDLLKLCPDVVFPALHGPPGEDGTIQGLLEMLNLPYVGSGVQASAFAMDKSVAKALFERAGLPLAEDRVFHRRQGAAAIAQQIAAELGESVVIKPMQQGSAIGVSPLPDGGDLHAAVSAALELGDAVLVERFIRGREMTVGVLDLEGHEAVEFPVIEITTAEGEWYDYDNRYTVGASNHIVPAQVPAPVAARLREIAYVAHQCLGLRDLSRADFILTDNDEPILLEVNTLPGMTPVSLYPDGAAAAGYPFPALLTQLLESALRRAR